MTGRLEGKVVVILGASDERSMGAATARRFAAEGAKLVLAARRLDAVKTIADTVGGLAVQCDICNEEDLAALAKAAIDHYGKLDVAINYAGVASAAMISDVTKQELQQQSDIHFVGSVLFFKHMGAVMSDGGSMITASSLTALVAPVAHAAYAGTKAGVDHVVKIAAVEYGGRGIRVNSIAPGFTESAMTADYFQMGPIVSAFEKAAALNRLGTVDDVANAALWLASDEAFVTGRVIDLTAGTALRRTPDADEMS